MGLTAAERKRRQRAHARNDHSLCNPATCPATLMLPPPKPITDDELLTSGNVKCVPSRGDTLVGKLSEGRTLTVGERLMAEQAGHVLDYIDELEKGMNGDLFTARIKRVAADGTVIYLVVTDAVKEVRQQRGMLRLLLNEFRQQAIAAAVLAGKSVTPVVLPTPVREDTNPLGDDDQGGDFRDLFAVRG